MRTKQKRFFILMAVVVAITTGYLGVQLANRFRAFKIEDHIADTFGPVANAIETYYTKNGSVPQSLNSLIPTYLKEMPRSPYSDSIAYTALPNNKWVLQVHSSILSPSRVYSWRSDSTFTDDERARLIKEYHMVAVLRDK